MATTRLPRQRSNPWAKRIDQLMALIVLLNVGIVLFDLSYVRFRDLYLRYLPQVTQRYDPIKGIEPFRDTEQYLAAVDKLMQLGIESPDAAKQLADLRDRSVAMIEEDPFRVANKSGGLEKLKNRMRQHMGEESSKAAFRQFWSQQHLTPQNWQQELAYFNRNFRPILAANYFRPIDESGDFVDLFWIIDLGFVGLFAVDIAARVLWIRKRRQKKWTEALLWRWYDLLLLLPFWRILRVIPLIVRLHHLGWVNLQAIQREINHNIAENIAGEVTELALLQTFRVVQGGIQQGALRQFIKEPLTMVEINEVDEVSAIAHRLTEIVTQSVLPNLQPELEPLLEHLVQQAIAQVPLTRSLPALPGFSQLSAELSKQIAHQSLQTLQSALSDVTRDTKGQALIQALGKSTLAHLQTGLTQTQALEEIEHLLSDWLEEIKLTLIHRLEGQDQTQAIQEFEAIRLGNKVPTVLPPIPTRH